MKELTVPTVPSTPIPLPTIDLTRDITTPELRAGEKVDALLDKIQKDWNDKGNQLICGGPGIELDEHERRRLGLLMGYALERGRIDVAQTVGLLWINRAADVPHPLGDMIDTLTELGRLDLVRPGILLLNKLCRALWTYRLGRATTPVVGFSADNLPDLMSIAEPQYDRIAYTEVEDLPWTQVANAWGQMVGVLSQKSSNWWSTRTKCQSMVVVISDLLETIPDTRAWAAGIFLRSTERGAGMDDAWVPWEIPKWVRMINQLGARLNAQEAPLVLGRLADAVVEADKNNDDTTGRLDSLNQIARRLIEDHPHLSMEDWLSAPPQIEDRLPPCDEGSRKTRRFIMGNGNGVMRPAEHLYRAAVKTYDILLGWLGPQHADEMSPGQRDALGEAIDLSNASSLPLAALRSALDYWDLSQETQPDPSDTDGDERPIGTRSIDERSIDEQPIGKPLLEGSSTGVTPPMPRKRRI